LKFEHSAVKNSAQKLEEGIWILESI